MLTMCSQLCLIALARALWAPGLRHWQEEVRTLPCLPRDVRAELLILGSQSAHEFASGCIAYWLGGLLNLSGLLDTNL